MEQSEFVEWVKKQYEEAVQQQAMLTLAIAQEEEELKDRERQLKVLQAEITQRRLKVEMDNERSLRMRGHVTAMQIALHNGASSDR